MSDNPFSQDPVDSTNPYAPSAETGTQAPVADPNDFEAYRNAHLSHEASVKSIGCLYYFGACFGVLIGLGYIGIAMTSNNAEVPAAFMAGLGVFVLGMGLAQGFVAHGIRELAPWARIAGIVLSAIGLLGVPVGTIISAYFLYLLVSHKGEVVFSDYYRHVIEQTPHIQYKTSIVVKILLGILVAFVVLGIVAAFIG